MDPNVLAAIARGVPFNALADFQAGLDNGRKRAEFLRQRDAQIRAGNALGAGNYNDAANALAQGNQADVAVNLLKSSDPRLNQADTRMFQPQVFYDTAGNPHVMQGSTAGGPLREATMPEGYIPAPTWGTYDTPQGVGSFNRRGPYAPGVGPAGTPSAPSLQGDGAAPEPTVAAGQQPGMIKKEYIKPEQDKTVGKGLGERQLGQPQAEFALGTAKANLQRLKQSASDLRQNKALGNIVGAWRYDPTGLIPASKIPSRPGSPEAQADAQFETLKSQTITNVLSAMREASKTGGALGNVSNYEDQLLQQNLAALSAAQDKVSLQRALKQIEDFADASAGRLDKAYNDTYGPQGSPPAGGGSGGNQRPPEIDEQTWGHMTPDEQRAYLEAPE